MREIYRRVYDNPIDANGDQKPNELLGVFTVMQQLSEDSYSEQFIGEKVGEYFLVEGREVSYTDGGTVYSVTPLKIPSVTTARQEGKREGLEAVRRLRDHHTDIKILEPDHNMVQHEVEFIALFDEIEALLDQIGQRGEE